MGLHLARLAVRRAAGARPGARLGPRHGGHAAGGRTRPRRRGCTGIWLDTFTFQAPGFYEKLGFTVFGRLEDYPPGEARVFYAKQIGAKQIGAKQIGAKRIG